MTDDDYRALQRRAQGAAALLDNPAWQEAYADVTSAVVSEWSNAAWSAPSLREQKFAEMRGLQMVRDRLQKWISDAKFEAAEREKRRLRRAA